MTSIQGTLLKMTSELRETVIYRLPVGDDSVPVNDLLGKHLKMEFLGEIHCIRCGRLTRKSFAQGYCYPCFTTAPETSECVLRPELCRAHEGISRDMEWSREHCLQDHFVYLAVTSGLKVGVTRSVQVPTRWIDQGASSAIRLARTPDRFTAGRIEVSLKEHMNDKTNWRRILTGNREEGIDLMTEKSRAVSLMPEDLREFVIPESEIAEISYPVLEYPVKVSGHNFDRERTAGGILTGIRGQYLMFRGGSVLNIRKHNGYLVELSF